MPAADCVYTYCTVRFYINKHSKKKKIPEKTRGICLCARDRRTAKERDIDTERQKRRKEVGWCKSAI